MLKYFLALAYPSFKVKNLSGYISTYKITEGFLTAALLSFFIYFSHYEIFSQNILVFINSLNAILGFYLLLSGDKKTLFWAGFFIALLWFYWIGFSFRFYDALFVIPIMILLVCLVYGMLFWMIGIFKNPFVKALLFLGFSFVHPMSFNWFIPELVMLDSLFGITKWQFGLFLLAIALFIELKSWYKAVAILALLGSVNYNTHEPLALSKQKIYLSQTSVKQDIKWEESYRNESIQNNLNIIYKAIEQKYEIVVISESAFALFLNFEPLLMEKLKSLSKEITIITGALYAEETDSYNSTYYFVDGEVIIANKVILVPFGEEIPLPKFLGKIVNEIFYNGAEDYKTADNPTDIEINGEIFRNAICYEATREELFEGNPKFMIATSNNAWFTPSIEPTLQKMLLHYFSRKHNTVIYHCANNGGTAVIH
ncbi:MAG TPA: apolipoprotein N-acyltransferase [Campylobacterales bacterium]|nr:apolipoprotein N-acyltransferase [Campylobacterales bacterium]